MFKYCPNCAAPASKFIDGKKFLCEECGFQIYHNTAAAVAVLLEWEDQYVLLKRGREPGRGMMDLPGGFVDPDESAEDACRREIREELGIEIKDLHYLASHHNTYPYKGITYKTCDLFFRAKCCTADFVRQESEIEEISLIDKGQLPVEDFAFESIKTLLKKIV